MKNVVICVSDFRQLCPEAYALLLKKGYCVTENEKGYPYDFAFYREAIRNAIAVVAGIEPWGREQLDLAPNLRVISRFGTGVNNIDCSYALQKGIRVKRAAGSNTNAVAEQTVALIYGLLKRLPALDRDTKAGKWHRPFCEELSGKTVGFLGFGRIAQKVAYKLQTSEVFMLAHDAVAQPEAAERLGVSCCGFEELLRRSDIVSVHIPLTDETKGILGKEQFAMMKPGAYLINTARGAIIRQEDLLCALDSGHLAGAGLDVFETEPVEKGSALAGLDQVVCSPYIASRTRESFRKTGLSAVQNILTEDETHDL